MTNWVALALGAALLGLVLGRAALGFARHGSRSPAQQRYRTRSLQGWILLAGGIFTAFAAITTTQSRVLEIVIAAAFIPLAIAILVNAHRSNAVGNPPAGGKASTS